MCREILVRSEEPIKPRGLLDRFALMTQRSQALDGDWQGDGCGIAWINGGQWQVVKSTDPIWLAGIIDQVGASPVIVAHARSASFPGHKGIEFSQPFIAGDYAFAVNMRINGVFGPLRRIPGKFGAEKVWYLLQQELKRGKPEVALEVVKQLMIKYSEKVVALNIVLATASGAIYWLNLFDRHPEYYTLLHWNEDKVEIVCSEPI